LEEEMAAKRDKRKKIMWLDIDDVLISFMPNFNNSLASKGINIKKQYIPQDWGYSGILSPEEMKKEISDFVLNKCNDLPPIEGAAEFTQRAREVGFKVFLITAHPSSLMMERLENLNRYGIVFDAYYSTSFFKKDSDQQFYIDKFELIKALGYGDKTKYNNILVDDNLKNVYKMVKAGLGIGVSIKRAYNQELLDQIESSEEDSDIRNDIMISRGGRFMDQQATKMLKMIEDILF
jgi:FMN phosphatase YigB (HAD superfamily)